MLVNRTVRNCCPLLTTGGSPGEAGHVLVNKGPWTCGPCLVPQGQLSGLARPHRAECVFWPNGPEMPPKCTQGLGGKHGSLGAPCSFRWKQKARKQPQGEESCFLLGLGRLWSPSTPTASLLPHSSTLHHGTACLLAHLSPCIKPSAR